MYKSVDKKNQKYKSFQGFKGRPQNKCFFFSYKRFFGIHNYYKKVDEMLLSKVCKINYKKTVDNKKNITTEL